MKNETMKGKNKEVSAAASVMGKSRWVGTTKEYRSAHGKRMSGIGLASRWGGKKAKLDKNRKNTLSTGGLAKSI